MRDIVLALTDGARLVAICLFWMLAALTLAWIAWTVLVDAHARWHQ